MCFCLFYFKVCLVLWVVLFRFHVYCGFLFFTFLFFFALFFLIFDVFFIILVFITYIF